MSRDHNARAERLLGTPLVGNKSSFLVRLMALYESLLLPANISKTKVKK
jgi:hypothetical protein